MKKLTPPLKWHGGKHYLARRIVALMPPHLQYVEPYAGGLSVLLARDPLRNWLIDDTWKLKHGDKVPSGLRGCSEVVNDIDGELINFWVTLQGKLTFEWLQELCEKTSFSQHEWEGARRKLSDGGMHSSVLQAWWFFIHCRQSLAGRMDTFAPLSKTRTRRGMSEQASAWLNAIDGLPAVHARLKRVVILNDDALDVIRKQDGPETLFYCDPPYLPETRTAEDVYKHEMTKDQHTDLLFLLSRIKGKFILSGYLSELYSDWARTYGFYRRDFEIANNASGALTKPRMTELAWMNFEPPEVNA